MATGTAGNTAQVYHTNQVHYITQEISYLTVDGATITFGPLPEGAVIVGGGVMVDIAFNDTSGNVLDVGVTGGDADAFGSDLALGTIGFVAFDDLASSPAYSATARTLTVAATLTGDGPTAGHGWVIVQYVVIR